MGQKAEPSDILGRMEECLRDLDALGATIAAAHLSSAIDTLTAMLNEATFRNIGFSANVISEK